MRRLLRALKRRGDPAVIHALRGKASNRRIDEEVREKAVGILSQEVYRGFRPTFAREHLSRYQMEVSRETVRKWMTEAKLWRPRRQTVEQVHQWRPRRGRYGELVQWDSSDHDWLEGRGEPMKLILMIDDATSKWFPRFVPSDSTEENRGVLERYLRSHGRPLAFYTDKASLFQTAVKTKREEQRQGKDKPEMPPTQIGRALQELGIAWIAVLGLFPHKRGPQGMDSPLDLFFSAAPRNAAGGAVLQASSRTAPRVLREATSLQPEYRSTQNWLQTILVAHGLAGGDRLLTLNGSTDLKERERVKAAFQYDPTVSPVRILLATDAASEGIDLQNHCSRLIHNEIPWNPNRMEQRNGRIDRHGQRAKEVNIYHFVGKGYKKRQQNASIPVGDLEADLEFGSARYWAAGNSTASSRCRADFLSA